MSQFSLSQDQCLHGKENYANDKYNNVIFLVPNVSKIVKLKARDYYNELGEYCIST